MGKEDPSHFINKTGNCRYNTGFTTRAENLTTLYGPWRAVIIGSKFNDEDVWIYKSIVRERNPPCRKIYVNECILLSNKQSSTHLWKETYPTAKPVHLGKQEERRISYYFVLVLSYSYSSLYI